MAGNIQQNVIPTAPPKDEAQIEGVLERVTYHNPQTGFSVAKLALKQDGDICTVKGILGGVAQGEHVQVWGTWEEHPDYGRQFSARALMLVMPETLLGIEQYLASKIPGVGHVLAKRIVKAFGQEVFEVLDNDPHRLQEVPKLPSKVIATIEDQWQDLKAQREVLVFMHTMGMGGAIADRVYRQYGAMSMEVLRTNPYRLALEVHGIGFYTADTFAMRQGLDANATARIEAGVLHTLHNMQTQGHTAAQVTDLAQRAAELLKVEYHQARHALEMLIKSGMLRVLEHSLPAKKQAASSQNSQALKASQSADDERSLLQSPARLHETNLVQTVRMHRAEAEIVARLQAIQSAEPRFKASKPDAAIAWGEKQTNIVLTQAQRRAVKAALSHKALVLTGGPGTGKTTIIRFMLQLTTEGSFRVALTAPTGKAAKRLSEVSGKHASTIHRLLEAGQKGFARNKERPLEVDLVIVDECSMVDALLMEALLVAIPNHARLVLVGDVDQLPSVGPGRVLADLIESRIALVERLETIFRQAEVSRIVANAHAIRLGNTPNLAPPAADERSDFYFVNEEDPEEIARKILLIVSTRVKEAFGFDPMQDVQVLTPMHRGVVGAAALNRVLQNSLNPAGKPKREMTQKEVVFREGDRVMQVRNDYEKQVFNGDVGEIITCLPQEHTLRVRFDEHEVEYKRKELDALALAYAITVHKAQGSEYPAVIVPLTTQHAVMLRRNLLYTAITRGRKLVVLVGAKRALNLAINNARQEERCTGLRQRLLAL